MACEHFCSVTMSDPRVMSQYHSFVVMLSGASVTRPTRHYALGKATVLMQLCSLWMHGAQN